MLYLSCHPSTNWVMFEFVNFDTITIRIVFGFVNTMEYLYVCKTRKKKKKHRNLNFC